MAFNTAARVDTILEQIRVFIRDEVMPLESTLLKQGFGTLLPTLAEKRQRVKELGLWAPHLPVEHGGLGLTLSVYP